MPAVEKDSAETAAGRMGYAFSNGLGVAIDAYDMQRKLHSLKRVYV